MCQECQKRAATMTVAPLRKNYQSISVQNIQELCQWFRRENIEIVTLRFETEGITTTIGLKSEIELLEEMLKIEGWERLRYEKLKKALSTLAHM